MASNKISVDDLAGAIADALEEYSDFCMEQLEDDIRSAINLTRREIRSHAPKDTGKYAKSWRTQFESTSHGFSGVAYAGGRQYSLTHLLENGHAKRGGGRVAARPHIEPAREKAEEQFVNDLIRHLEGG